MIDYIVQGIKFLFDLWALLSDDQKESAKSHVADGFENIFREFFRSATDEAGKA